LTKWKSSSILQTVDTSPWNGSNDDPIAFTTVKDLTYVVARDIGFEGEWPVVGVSQALISPSGSF
jgi:hypothetical protein